MVGRRKTLRIDEKVALIRAIEKSGKKSDVARRFGLRPSTVTTIWKSKDKILQAGIEGKSCKTLRKPKFEDLDQVMVTWINKQRHNNVQVSGPVIKAKAEKFAQLLDIKSFKASEGWLGKFKLRHKINCAQTSKGDGRRDHHTKNKADSNQNKSSSKIQEQEQLYEDEDEGEGEDENEDYEVVEEVIVKDEPEIESYIQTQTYKQANIRQPKQHNSVKTHGKTRLKFAKKRIHRETNVRQLDSRLLETLRLLRRSGVSRKKDECDSFGEYIADSLRKHDDRTQSMIKQAINNILFEQEMKKYRTEQYTVVIANEDENPLILGNC